MASRTHDAMFRFGSALGRGSTFTIVLPGATATGSVTAVTPEKEGVLV